MARKVISICFALKSQVDKMLMKTHFAHRLQNQYFAAMAHNLLKAAPHMTFTRFQVECITIFGSRSRKTTKETISTNVVKTKKVELTSQ